jgi:pseudouridine-5'-phosphate glycosidase
VSGAAVRTLIAEEVAAALAAGGPVVALESTIISHGLPRPRNLEVARELEATVRAGGAVPATIALLDGVVRIGLDEGGLRRLAEDPGVVKASVRDLPLLAARGGDGATTVAATAHLAHRAGIRVFATGGLGGVHRGAAETFDESADLPALARTPIVVVCAGVKSILDAAATLERLETLGVPVVGYRTSRLPGFTQVDGGHDLVHRLDTAAAIAAARRAADELGVTAALIVTRPVDDDAALDPAVHDAALASALADAARQAIGGKDVTPFLLDAMQRATGGASLAANLAAVRGNTALAAGIAVALAGPD